MRSKRGFTLLELLVVLVLVAIMSATVVMKWSGIRHGATLDAAVRQLEFQDTHMRRYARSHGRPCSLAFDLKTHRVRKQYHTDPSKNPAAEAIGRGIQIQTLNVNGQGPHSSKAQVSYHRDGTSDTFGITLSTAGDRQVWLIVAGISGQFTRLESKRDYEATLQLLATPA